MYTTIYNYFLWHKGIVTKYFPKNYIFSYSLIFCRFFCENPSDNLTLEHQIKILWKSRSFLIFLIVKYVSLGCQYWFIFVCTCQYMSVEVIWLFYLFFVFFSSVSINELETSNTIIQYSKKWIIAVFT